MILAVVTAAIDVVIGGVEEAMTVMGVFAETVKLLTM